MHFERITSPSLKELFVSQLERMILSGELEVGTQIPAERDLASRWASAEPSSMPA